MLRRSDEFLTRLRQLPRFDFRDEFETLAEKHGDSSALVQAVVDDRLVPKDDACRCWADAMNVAYVDPFASVITDEAIARIPPEIARKARALGLYIVDGVLTLAMAEPKDADLIRRLSHIAQMPVSPVFSLPREIEDAIAVNYSTEQTLGERMVTLERSSRFEAADGNKVAALAENNGVAQTLDDIIFLAIRERATDIHLEPSETSARIRFRIDGNLREILTYSRKLHRALVSRIKVLSNLNIAETRIPQDGRFSMNVGTQLANFRVSMLPTPNGEKSVLRVLALGGPKTMLTLDRMMISQPILHPLRRLIRNPNGILFVTGPTGSGKTTTLYAALHEIATPGTNISTIEDPIEIQLPGITQTQTNPAIDLNFSTILRALLRQDPDVLLIGEIRDVETARIATEAALTGHLVLATLHTNTAPQAIVRLTGIGVEPHMVAPSVIGVLSQRLAGRICENCKEPYQPAREVLQKYFVDEGLTDVTFYRGRGCPACRHTGYKGRIAFHELLVVTDEIRTLITEGRSVHEITRAAAKVGYKPLRYDGLKKVLLGLTTIDEIEQNTPFEWAT